MAEWQEREGAMNRTRSWFNGLLMTAIVLVAVVSICAGESSTAPGAERPEPPPRTFRPAPGRGALPRPRRIEGGSYYYELAEVHKRYGVYDKAIEMLQTAIEKETDATRKTRYYDSLGEVYQMQGKPKEAAAQIKKAFEGAQTIEEKCRYSNILGRIYEQAGDIESAQKAYEYVVENAAGDSQKRSAEVTLYRLYQKSGALDNIVAALEKKVEQNPDDEESLDKLAQIFNSVSREPARALPVYERLAKLKPKDQTILNRLVYLYQMNKDYEKAAEVYQRMMDITPSRNKSYYYQHVSRMYMMAGKSEEAIRWAERSISEGLSSPYAYVSAAQLYLQNNLPDKAFELYDKAVESCRRPTEKHQVSLRFGDMFAQNKREDKAEELYKSVMEEATLATFRSQARSRLITLYRKQGKTAEIQTLMGEGGKEEVKEDKEPNE